MKNFRSLILITQLLVIIFLSGLVVFHSERAVGSPFTPLKNGPKNDLRNDPLLAESTAVIFLPSIYQGGSQTTPAPEPLLPEIYESEQNTPPELPDAPPAAPCQSFIRFSNYTNFPVYIYWNRPDGTDTFYKLIDSGRQYWQHTYLGNQWHIRDDQGRLIKALTASRCDNTFIDTYISDLPACGRITSVALWDMINDRALPGYESLTDGVAIPVATLTNVNLRVLTTEVIESIKFDLNGALLISNVSPYAFPGNQQPWQPESGIYTLVIDAYRQNNATSALCDQRRLLLQVGDSSTPVSTLTPTSTALTTTPTPSPIASVTPTSMATSTVTPPATVTATSTPSPTATPRCSGRITAMRLFNLTTSQPILAYDPIPEGAVIDLATLPPNFNLDLSVSGFMESVRFEVNGAVTVENFAPYRYPGGDIVPWRPAPGVYTIRSIAYSQNDAAGFVCDIQLLSLTFTRSTPTATPTPMPSPTLTPGVAPNCIGDWAWRDTNANGLQDAGELGLANLEIYLWRDDNLDGRPDRVVTSTRTDSSGYYAFCNLAPATYLVEFGAADGCVNAPANQGANDAIDSDANIERGISPPILLNAGDANSTVDAGFICY